MLMLPNATPRGRSLVRRDLQKASLQCLGADSRKRQLNKPPPRPSPLYLQAHHTREAPLPLNWAT